jgi:hypothetical protein
MTKVAFVLGVSAISFVVGCGSSSSGDPFGAEPDYGAVKAHFDHPDGTFGSGNAASVFASSTGSGSANVGNVFAPSGGSSSPGGGNVATKSKSLRILGDGSAFHCTALEAGQRSGSCACPTSGSFSYQIDGAQTASGQSSDVTMKLRIDACAAGDTVVDGHEFLHMTSSSAGGNASYSMLFVVDIDVRKGAESHHWDLQESYSNGKVELAARVDDGWVVVVASTSSDGTSGTFTVRDRNGSWTCTETAGAGSCTSDKGAHVDWHS